MDPHASLSRRERQIMDVIWARGRVTAVEVWHALPDAPSGSSVRTFLRILEAKGMVFLGGVSALGWSRLIGNFGPRVFNRGRPNREELARAEEFGRKLLAKM